MARVERFSQSARRILLTAQEEAERLQNTAIEPTHVLLAMLHVENTVAYRALSDLKVEYSRVQAVVRAANPGDPAPPKNLDLAPETRRLLESALQISRKRGDTDIGSEHLLLAVIKGEDKSIRYVMRQINLEPPIVRNCIERVLQKGADSLPPTRPFTVSEPFDEETEKLRTQPDTDAQSKVLRLIETGKISAQEGAELLQALRLATIPIPENGGFLLIPFENTNVDAARSRSVHFIVNGAPVSVVPFEQAQAELLRLLRSAYSGAPGTSATLGDLKITLE